MPVTSVASAEHIVLFGARLKSLRLKAGLTRKNLSEKCGISPHHLNKIERGASGPSFGAIHALAAALEIDPAVLFTPEAEENMAVSSEGEFQEDYATLSNLLPHTGLLHMHPVTALVSMSTCLCALLRIAEPPKDIPLELFLQRYVVSADCSILGYALNKLASGIPFSSREIRLQPEAGLQVLTVVHGTTWKGYQNCSGSVCAVFIDVTYMEKNIRNLTASLNTQVARQDENKLHKQLNMELDQEIQELRRTQRQLHNLKCIINGVVRFSRDDLFILTPELHILDSNRELARLCKGKCDPEVKCRLIQIVNQETYTVLKSMAGQAITTGRLIMQEINNSDQVLECGIYPVFNAADHPYRLLLRMRDVTDARKQSEALRQQSLLLQKAEEVARMGSWKLDLKADIFSMSPNWSRIHGITSKVRELSVQELFPLAHPDDLHAVHECLQRAVAGESEYRIEHRIICQDSGEVRWVDARGELVRDENHEPVAIYGVAQDVTEIRQSWEKMAQNHHRLEQMLEFALAGYWDWDIRNDTVYLSPMFKKLFGYQDHELDNSPDTWKKMIFPQDLPLALEAYQQHTASRGSRPYEVRVRYRHRNGSTVWVLCTGTVLEWDEQGTPLRMIGCHVDITNMHEQLNPRAATTCNDNAEVVKQGTKS